MAAAARPCWPRPRQPPVRPRQPPIIEHSIAAAEAEIVARLTRARQAADIDGIVALLSEEVWLTMPPVPLEYHGTDLAAALIRFENSVLTRFGLPWSLPGRAGQGPD